MPYFLSIEPFGYTPIIFDNDGSIIDKIYGQNASLQYLGFGGPTFGNDNGRILESLLIINGKWYNDINTTTDPERSLNDFKGTIAHEVGHIIGLDHSSINDSALSETNNTQSARAIDEIDEREFIDSVPLMFPVGISSLPDLRQDDKSSISLLYPNQNTLTNFGKIEGKVLREDKTTPVLGANIIARNIEDPTFIAISCVSDYLDSGAGSFSLTALPPGMYTLEIEPINSYFSGSSTVGPHANNLCDDSFLYPVIKGYYNNNNSPTTSEQNNASVITIESNQTVNNIEIIANTNVANSRNLQCMVAPPNFSGSSSSGDPNQLCCPGFLERESNQVCPSGYLITFCENLSLPGCCPRINNSSTTSSSGSLGPAPEKKCPICLGINAGGTTIYQVASTDESKKPFCNSGGSPKCTKGTNGDSFFCDNNGNITNDFQCVDSSYQPIPNTNITVSMPNIPDCMWSVCGNNCCVSGCCESNPLVCSGSADCSASQSNTNSATGTQSDSNTSTNSTTNEFSPPSIVEPPIFITPPFDTTMTGSTTTTPSGKGNPTFIEISSAPTFPQIVELPLVSEEFTGISVFAYPGSNPSFEVNLPSDQIKSTVLYVHLKDSKDNIFQNIPFSVTSIPSTPGKIILSLKLPEQISTGKLQFTLFLHTGKSIHGFINIIDPMNIQNPETNLVFDKPEIVNISEIKSDESISLLIKGTNFVGNRLQVTTDLNDIINLNSLGGPQTTITIFPSNLNMKAGKLNVSRNSNQIEVKYPITGDSIEITDTVIVITTPRGIVSRQFKLK